MTEPLHPFEGRAVTRASIKFKNTGTDLSNPLAVDPIELPPGWEGYALCKVSLHDIAHLAIKEKGELTEEFERAHTLRIDVVTLVDEEFARPAINEQRRKVEEMRDRQGTLPVNGDGSDEPAGDETYDPDED